MFDGFSGFWEISIRLTVAVVMGGLIGLERQVHGRWTGVRTHMLVAMGAAIFILTGEYASSQNNAHEQLTRVIQGVAAGVGFLGAGTILKLSDKLEVKGLTTASSIWVAAALGTVAGLGAYHLAAASLVVSLLILAVLRPLEKRFGKLLGQDDIDSPGDGI